MAATAQSFGISIGVNGAFGLLMFFIFSILRKTNYFSKFYCSKRCVQGHVLQPKPAPRLQPALTPPCRYMAEEDQEVRPRPLKKSFFAWILPTWKASEDEVVLVAGVDAAMYLRIFKYGKSGRRTAGRRPEQPSTGNLLNTGRRNHQLTWACLQPCGFSR